MMGRASGCGRTHGTMSGAIAESRIAHPMAGRSGCRRLALMDEFTRECLAIDVAKRLTSEDVLELLSDLFVHRGVPEHIRSDNGSEYPAECVREWLGRVGVKTLFIEPGSPWENGYVESFFRVAPGRAAGEGGVRHAARGQGAH